jgi:hypothetical protein
MLLIILQKRQAVGKNCANAAVTLILAGKKGINILNIHTFFV